ncbi:MAG TPA: hypothetical protein VE983_00510 [Solirubrobacteraceae bacterium]|nr:hypothetical protein [Solirubrobacteraceae bacterium]
MLPQRGVVVRRLASLGLMPAAAFAVHQLRYWLAFGSRAGAELQAQGHSYLHSVVPWLVLVIAISLGVFLRALGRAFGGTCSVPRLTVSFIGLWLACAACLVAIYCAQEFLEGLFATGHPGGLIGIFGYGGWWAIPAALAVGLVLAAVFHGAWWVLQEVAHRHRRIVWRAPRRVLSTRTPPRVFIPRAAPLAGGWSGRGPPG